MEDSELISEEEILINGFTPNLENLLNKKAGRDIYND